jgi:hypothetical protein
MEFDSSSDVFKEQTPVSYGNTSHLYAGAFGSILILISKVPSFLFNLTLSSSIEPNPITSWYVFLTLGALVAVIGGILLGLGLMALMKRYGKSYGSLLFIAIILPYIVGQYTAIFTPTQAITFGLVALVVGLITSALVGIGILSVRSQSVNPNITIITGIFTIANPIVYAFSGLLLIIVEDYATALLMYFITGFGFSFLVNILLAIMFNAEARSGGTRELEW